MSAPGSDVAQARPRDDNVLELRGTLGFDTVPELLAPGVDWVRRTAGALTIDLAAVGRIDSAGLALLVEWVNLAQGRPVRLINVPEQARELIRVYRLSAALGLDPDA